MTRGGLEAGFDLRAAPKNRYIEVHVLGGGSVTGLSAKGRYCQTQDGYGMACDGMPPNVEAQVAGAYPSLFVGLALEVANRLGFFHGLRVQTLAAAGTMPSIRYGEQRSATSWTSAGVGLAVAFGVPDRDE